MATTLSPLQSVFYDKPTDWKEKLHNFSEDIFYFGRKAYVIQANGTDGSTFSVKQQQRKPLIPLATKVMLYVLTLPVLISGIIILVNRLTNKYVINKEKSSETSTDSDNGLKEKKILLIHLQSADTPHEVGRLYGKQLKNEINKAYKTFFSYAPGVSSIDGQSLRSWEKTIPKKYLEEMKGLAEGAEIPLKKVKQLHWYVDKCSSTFACSILSTHGQKRVAAVNTYKKDGRDADERYKTLMISPVDSSNLETYKKVLRDKNVQDRVAKTAQSIIFGGDLSVHLAVAEKSAANTSWTAYSSEEVFDIENQENHSVMARNLDWSNPLIYQFTLLVVHDPGEGKNKFVNVSFPGYLGVLTGMNEKGVSVGCCVVGSHTGQAVNAKGISNPMIYRKVLEEASTTEEAVSIMKTLEPAFSMNMGIAGPDGVAILELDPLRQKKGSAYCEYG